MLSDSEEVSASTSLNELGMDSMMKTQLRGVVEENYGVELEEEMLFDDETTLEKIRLIIENGPIPQSGEEKTQEMERISAKPSRPKKRGLFSCFGIC